MAWFRVRGNSITLVHGVRTPAQGVRQRRIRTFSGAEDLRRHLPDDAWARLQVQVEQEHPSLSLDWAALREQAQALAGPPPARSAQRERIRRLRRTLKRLVRELPGDDQDVARAVGPLLRQVARRAVRLHDCYPSRDTVREELLEDLFPDPEFVGALVERGRSAMRRSRAKGLELFDMARRCDPYDPDTDNSEGICWLELGDLERAEQRFQSARDLALCQLPDPDRAYSWTGLEVRPYARATFNLGLVRERQGRLAEALELFEECLRRCPDDGVGARFRLGPLHQRLGHLQRALECHRQACREPGWVEGPDSYFDTSCVLLQLNDPRAAVEPLLHGFVVNAHIPRLLLKPPKRLGADPPYCTVESADWARNYLRHHGDLWSPEALAFLEHLWRAPEVRERLALLRDLEEELELAEDRSAAVERLFEFRDEPFPKQVVQALQERMAAWWRNS